MANELQTIIAYIDDSSLHKKMYSQLYFLFVNALTCNRTSKKVHFIS